MSLTLAKPQLDDIALACRQHRVLRMHLGMTDAVRNPYVRADIDASNQLIYEA